RLGLKQPTHQPKATEVMDEIISLIKTLVDNGNAYAVGGDVYFWQQSLPEYGSLSGKKIEDQKTGARVEENTQKRHPADFTLWKNSKPGEPQWDSPWGKGRPGWHSECVVMSQKYLGETFDIHGGGVDLVFPHHENEMAQALAITGKPLANYWMHNGFLNIEGEKMSKSLKNFYTARDILSEYDAEVIRFFFLSKHYRSPIDFNRELIEESDRALKNIYSSLRDIDYLNLSKTDISGNLDNYRQQFTEAMDDDFNTAKAIATLFELSNYIKNVNMETGMRQAAAILLVELGGALGFFQNLAEKLNPKLDSLANDLIDLIISYRLQARSEKNWAQSDKIRDDLNALGIELKDTKDGCIWKLKD
ncbi:MAG: cysteine--tRNA ligase, partial [Candidatus Cloacimonadaceae bacterium]|nr:cysteine--tRNA ligase [Candidatus Cloacimonadaceae bacterium]